MAALVFEERSGAVLEALVGGASIEEASRLHGAAARTIKMWLEKGRKDPGSRYGAFAGAVDAARAERRLPGDAEELDEAELRRVMARSARAGNVQAARFYYEVWLKGEGEVKADEFDPLAEADEIARRRGA